MKALCKSAAKTFFKMVEGLDQYGERTIENSESFMPVHVMDRGAIAGHRIYSVAHFGEQNGDAMADPEMDFMVGKDGQVYPMSYRNDYIGAYRIGAEFDENGNILFRQREQADEASFANTWMKNIKDQQGLN